MHSLFHKNQLQYIFQYFDNFYCLGLSSLIVIGFKSFKGQHQMVIHGFAKGFAAFPSLQEKSVRFSFIGCFVDELIY